jgi:hypothetical protein
VDQLSTHIEVNPQFALPGETLQSVNMECPNLSYCRVPDGTATFTDPLNFANQTPDICPQAKSFVECDSDGDGLPNLFPNPRLPGMLTTFFFPRAPLSAMTAGDTMVFHIVTDKSKTDYASTLGPFFVTTPVIKTVDGYSPSYPVKEGDRGTQSGQPIELSSTKVTYVAYRPQRLAIQGAESGTYMDMGHLKYSVEDPTNRGGDNCPLDSYSDTSPTLTPEGNGPDQWLSDSADDSAPDPQNTIAFTVDFAKCVAEDGGPSIAGQRMNLTITARTPRGESAFQKFIVHFPS